MKKVVCFGLCFLIVLSSFVLSFAADASPVILPVGDVTDNNFGYRVSFENGSVRFYRSNSSPVYFAFAYVNDSLRVLVFSDSPGSYVTYNVDGSDSYSTWYLSNEYDGFYYSIAFSVSPDDNYIMSGNYSSVNDLIDSIGSSVFSTVFDISYIVDGSVSWLSSMAQAAKNNGLLLFLVTVSMVGVGIGLFNRFRR